MKKIYFIKAVFLLLLGCFALAGAAQVIPPTAEIDNSFYNRMNYVFNPLEKNRVPYGLLKDFAMEFTDLERYNGSVNDSNYVDDNDFFDIYQTLFTSRIHSNAGSMVNPIVADSLWYLQRDVNLITIGGLCYGYSYFREDAYSSGLLTINNDQISDRYINSVWQNPYQTGLSVAFAPAITEHQGRNISVLIPSVAWFTNQQVSSIQLEAGDGNGYQTLTVGQASSVFYPDSGLKTLNFKVTLANSQILYSHSQIHIANSVNPADDVPPSQYQTYSLVAGPQEVESDEEYEGKKAKGYITIRYANPNDPVLRRPLIIAEGYDTGHITNPEEKFGANNFNQFIDEINGLPVNSLQQILINNPQYDLVYVDWKKGTDDLYRNAKLLKKVIELVNADKVAVNGVMQENVIIGQSMGGVITRIALREMENEGKVHQTRLFISQDSPQQGANTPIAYQYMGRHFRNIYISTGVVALGAELVQLIRGGASPLQSLSLSNQPASKQMLINYISDFGTLRNVHHDDFYASLRLLGYPQGTTGHPFRMVAISNGSECANSQGFEPGASLLSIDGKIQTRFLGDVAFSVLSYYATPFFPLSRIFKIGILPGKNEFNANINLHSIGNGGGNQVYYCDINYKKKLFYLINVNVTLAHKEKDADNGMIPIDGYRGGFLFPTAGLQSASLTNWFIKYNLNVSVNRPFNFIPTTSSLDIGGGSIALGSPDFLRVYSASSPPAAPKQTPFANFIVARQDNVASVNEDHISFTARNADWAGNEIGTVASGPNPQIVDCSYLCNGSLQIEGPPEVCYSQDYYISSLPTGSTVTWSKIGNSTGLAQNNNIATLTKTGDGGTVTLTATITTPCGSLSPVSRELGVGTPMYVSQRQGPGVLCPGDYAVFNISATGATTYNWTYDTNTLQLGNYPTGGNTSQLILQAKSNYDGGYARVDISNECGTSQTYGFWTLALQCSSGFYSYRVYPNPTTDQLMIDYNGGEGEKSKKEFSVKLISNKGEALREAISKDNKVKLDILSIVSGTYYLHIKDGKQTIKKQIIIKH